MPDFLNISQTTGDLTMTEAMITFAQSGFDARPAFGPCQPQFAMASHNLTSDEAAAIAADLIASPSCGPFDLWKLLGDGGGRARVAHVLGRMEERYGVTVDDKRADLAGILFRRVLEPVFDVWCDEAFVGAARRLVEPAFLERMTAVGASSDALCVEIDGYVQTLNFRAAPSLFSRLEFTDGRIPVVVQKLVMNNMERFLEFADRGGETTVTDMLPSRMACAATGRHGRFWIARDPSSIATFEDGRVMGAVHLLYDVLGEWSKMALALAPEALDDAAARSKPIRNATTEDPAVLLAKVMAVAAVLAANHPGDGAFAAIARAICRHTLPSASDTSDSVAPGVAFLPDSQEAGDAFRKLLDVFEAEVGWGDDRVRRGAGG